MFLISVPLPRSRVKPASPGATPSSVALLLLLSAVWASGCGTPGSGQGPRPLAPSSAAVHARTGDLTIDLVDTLDADNTASLVKAPGWTEFRLKLRNRSTAPLIIADVRMLTAAGRYLDSADSLADIESPPDPGSELATDVARRSAGIAAGQLIPLGGTLVGVMSDAASALAARERAELERRFSRRRLKDVELDPGGWVYGSSFLPDVADARILVVDYRAGERAERVKLPLAAGE